jgi:hypothetical protein
MENNQNNKGNNLQGKEKDVFTKKQILMFFDLLSETDNFEKINYKNPNLFEPIAILAHAFTSKSVNSFIDELKDHRTKELYEFHKPGELQYLINQLVNMEKFFRAAGLRSIANVADRKIILLESYKKD